MVYSVITLICLHIGVSNRTAEGYRLADLSPSQNGTERHNGSVS